jgi:ESCRT-II complex subunit VPS36
MFRGIGGIERKMREQDMMNDRHINEAFQDLQQLMDKAKDMSQLAESITKKLKEKGNREISEDEAVLLRSELMKMGLEAEMEDLADISRKNYAHKSLYYQDLGKTIGKFLTPIVAKHGGQMALTDVFCTINRARGLNVSTRSAVHW